LGNQGRRKEAIAAYREAVRIKPGDTLSRRNLAWQLRKCGDNQAAEGECREALRLDPHDKKAHFQLANILLDDEQRLEETISEYQAALADDADYVEAHFNLGLAFERRGAMKWAVIHFQEAKRLRPEHAKTRFFLGFCLSQAGEKMAAIEEMREAVRLAPRDAYSRCLLGAELAGDSQTREGFRELGRGLCLRPWDARLWLLLLWMAVVALLLPLISPEDRP